VQRRADAGLPPEGSFEAVAREWLAVKHEKEVTPAQANRTLRRLERDVFPFLGREPLDSLRPPAILKVLRMVEARGAVDTAHRLKQACSAIFRFGVASGRCESDPVRDLRGQLVPPKTTHYKTILDPLRVGALLRDIEGYVGHPVTRAALRLAPLVFVRPGELRAAEWAEIDLDAAEWSIPAAKMKMKLPHVVPLSRQAVAVLRELHPLTGAGRFVFPSILTGARCMSNNTTRNALRRLGYGNEEISPHGFRSMARTLGAEKLDISEAVLEALLAHRVPDALGRAYNRTEWREQKRDAVQKWGDYLDRLRDGAKVIPLSTVTNRTAA
jgi:integrase